ncbi:flagellin [Marinobacter sp. NSM]|uniref:flagellin n=1 Tax=Marinobacter sp. NSM TaxID=3458004 RepID=UPI0040359794
MPQVINTNIASLNAQRNLNASQGDANVALQRLSSGLRINSAKDDAAGLAISERFQSQIAGLNQAQRNANDGISLAQTAEGAMDEITNNLQRIRELAVQSANATNSQSDQEALNQEVQQRIEEINRIASQTSFNGLKILDGTFDTQTFQVGANTGETISVSGLDSRGSQIGSILSYTNGIEDNVLDIDTSVFTTDALGLTYTAGVTFTTVEIDGQALTIPAIAADPGNTIGDVQTSLQNAIDADSELSQLGITVGVDADSLTFTSENGEAVPVNLSLTDGTATYSQEFNLAAAEITSIGSTFDDKESIDFVVTVNGQEIDVTASSLNDIIAKVNSQSPATGVKAFLDSDNDEIIFSSQFGQPFEVLIQSDTDGNGDFTDPFDVNLTITGDASNTTTLNDIDISTRDGAEVAMIAVDFAIDTINGFRAELGAVQNRFESTIANLSTTSENLSASNSRIRDADFAAETAELARTQVLQQAGLSVLAQANARPQQVLQLLQG